MPDYREDIDEVAKLMTEFRLAEARLETRELMVAFKRRSKVDVIQAASVEHKAEVEHSVDEGAPVEATEPQVVGMPITSPMNGIFYGSPSPSTPPFVKEGEAISAGQIVGLIEAMKVFNEIPSPISGTVVKVVAETGAIVQPGDVLMLVG